MTKSLRVSSHSSAETANGDIMRPKSRRKKSPKFAAKPKTEQSNGRSTSCLKCRKNRRQDPLWLDWDSTVPGVRLGSPVNFLPPHEVVELPTLPFPTAINLRKLMACLTKRPCSSVRSF